MLRTIIYIGGELPDKDASALRIMANAKALRAYGFRVILVGERKYIEGTEKTEIDEFETFLLPLPSRTKEWVKALVSCDSYVDIIKQYTNVETVICYNFHAEVLQRLIRYGKKNKIAVVSDCTEWHTVHHLRGIKRLIKWLDINRRIRTVQFRTSGNIVISSYFDSFYRGCRNVIVPPLIDKSEEKWTAQETNSDNETTTLVYAGRMGIGKDQLSACISALSELSDYDFHLNVVGINKDEYLTAFPKQSDMLNCLGNKVEFYGYISHKEAVRIVRSADFSLLIRENNRKNDSGFPTKLAESVACGTPVIASDFSDVKKYVEQYGLGMVANTVDDEGLIRVLKEALTLSSNELYELKQNCSRCTAFDYRSYIGTLGEFIDTVVGGVL
jgi:glycosyltransferase involved in cell wall biosynthesis